MPVKRAQKLSRLTFFPPPRAPAAQPLRNACGSPAEIPRKAFRRVFSQIVVPFSPIAYPLHTSTKPFQA